MTDNDNDTSMENNGKSVRFIYRELNSTGTSLQENEYSGIVHPTDRAGQFVLRKESGANPIRFERCSVVRWL